MTQFTMTPAKQIGRIVLGVVVVLLLPLALTLLNSSASIYGGAGGGFDWMPGDFVVMGILLLLAGLAIDVVVRNLKNSSSRVLAVVGVVLLFLAVWVELAVEGVSQLVQFLVG
ncbi:MAG: hypothetical protein AAB582_02975 [Patescibacteria group bacterium]